MRTAYSFGKWLDALGASVCEFHSVQHCVAHLVPVLRLVKTLIGPGLQHGAGWRAACARRELAPLALYAYPEAYSDFKQTMQVRRCSASALPRLA